MTDAARPIVELALRLSDAVDGLAFGGKVAAVYNPLVYAREPALDYLRRFARPGVEVVLVGMNPGPWGMAQTGVPFGAIPKVRDWLGVRGRVEQPAHVHPARPIEGFACERVEVSGTRLWGWLQDTFGTPQALARWGFVWSYCPLAFMTETGANLTPDKLPRAERDPLLAPCDEALRALVAHLRPRFVIGVGAWAERRARAALKRTDAPPTVGRILHPSPASPLANHGWADKARDQLRELGAPPPPRTSCSAPPPGWGRR